MAGGIKRRERKTDPATEAAIAQFGAGADAHAPSPAQDAAQVPVTATPSSAPVQERRALAVRAARRVVGESYEELAERYAHLGRIDLYQLPDTSLLRHSGTKEDALLIALLAEVEDRSKHQIMQLALLDGLRAWSARLEP